MMAATSSSSSSSSSFSLRDVNLDDLLAGTGPYTGLQKSVRLTFKCLTEAVQQQVNEMTHLREQQQRRDSEMAALTEQVQTSSVSMRTIRTLLEGHVEALRAEFTPKVRGLEARVQDMGSRLDDVEQQQQRHHRRYHHQEDHAASSNKEDDTHQIMQRLERLQADVTRLSRTVESKADQEEVAAALQQRVSKTSLAKRIHAILEEDEQNNNSNRNSASSTAYQRLKAKLVDQEEVVRRILHEMEAVKTHVLGSSGEANGRAEDSITTIMKNLQSMMQQQGRRVHRAEKDVGGLRDRVLQDLAALDTKVEERCRVLQQQQHEQQEQQQQLVSTVRELETAPPVTTTTTTTAIMALEEQVKAFERDIVKELDVRDAEVRRHLDSTNSSIRALETKMQFEENRVQERLNKAEDAMAFQSGQRLHVLHRVERLEQQQLNLTAGVSTAMARSSSSVLSPVGVSSTTTTTSPAATTTAAAARSFIQPSTPDPTRAYQNVQQQQQQQLSPPQRSPPPSSQARSHSSVGGGGGGVGGYCVTGPTAAAGGGGGRGGSTTLPPRPSTSSSTMPLRPGYSTMPMSSSLSPPPTAPPAPPARSPPYSSSLSSGIHPHAHPHQQQQQQYFFRDTSSSQHPPPPIMTSPRPHLPQHLQQHQQQQQQQQQQHQQPPSQTGWSFTGSASAGGGGGRPGGGGEGGGRTGGSAADWRGGLATASSLGSPTPTVVGGRTGGREGGSAGATTGGVSYSQEELEALRREKLMLRTRIREGIMSQSS